MMVLQDKKRICLSGRGEVGFNTHGASYAPFFFPKQGTNPITLLSRPLCANLIIIITSHLSSVYLRGGNKRFGN
jgi:hypothetical protein